jgi:histidine triad (HIT) family protein
VSSCPFCLPQIESEIIAGDDHCFVIWSDPTPVGSLMVLPRVHRTTMFDLSDDEWVSTRRLLERMRERLTETYAPDGWNVGWNIGRVGGQTVDHAHCHLLPRYETEPLAGKGIRAWFKDPSNRPPHHATTARPPSSW